MLNYASAAVSIVAFLFFTNAFAAEATALDLLSQNNFFLTKEDSTTPFNLTRLQSHSDSSVEYRYGTSFIRTCF